MRAPALALALLLSAPFVASVGLREASADGFDEKAEAATPLHDAKSMTALFWSQGAGCSSMKNDLLKRQCQGVRNQRQRRISGATYIVEVGAEAIEIATDPKKMSVEVSLRSCLWCGSEGPMVLGKGAHKMNAGQVSAAIVGSKTKMFKKGAGATHWGSYVAPRLRGQLLVKVPASVEQFKEGGRKGYKVQVVGYRLYDPCQGDVLAASPASTKGPVAVSTCEGEPALKDGGSTVAKVPVIVHPDRLNTSQIKTAMKDVSEQTQACFDAYGIQGMATFKMIIAGSGKLAKSEQSGDFEGTPTGICLDKAIKAAKFPKSKKKATPITYPIVLR